MSLMKFIHASAHDTGLPEASVHAIICSPPFFGLRKYAGDQELDWPGVEYAPIAGSNRITIPALHCALGNEETIEAFIGHLILCLREWWRILRADGTCFVDLADSSVNDKKWGGHTGGKHVKALHGDTGIGRQRRALGLPAKSLTLIPQRFALAAQAEGWSVRAVMIGAKSAPMRESVKDRPTRSYDQIFMLAKQERYFCDMLAVRNYSRKQTGKAATFARKDGKDSQVGMPHQNATSHRPDRQEEEASNGSNMLDVFTWNPAPFPGAHFATWPPAIPERFIKMSTSPIGCCPTCGAQWIREITRQFTPQTDVKTPDKLRKGSLKGLDGSNGWDKTPRGTVHLTTTGWKQACKCAAGTPTPSTVLDPFSGSGTTAKEAARLGRYGIGIDLSLEYLTTITEQRIGSGIQMSMGGL